MTFFIKNLALIFFVCLLPIQGFSQSYPEGFTEEVAYNQFGSPATYIPVFESLEMVVELTGKIYVINNGVVAEEPLIDISDEVGTWADLGLISAAVHPDFESNGYIYLLYNVDRYHLFHSEDEDYDPTANDYYNGGMGRITRYTVNTVDFSSVIPNSRFIIHGDEIGTGVPLCSDSHGLGTIAFGEDGSLIVSTGDANSYHCCYNGEGAVPLAAYDSIAFNDGILRADELIGGFRSQYLDGLNGKVLRLHPETGDGLPGNPYFDPENPSAARSQIWALGFRNPFRFTIQPNTGYGDLTDGHPGVIYLSDVGETKWEELNIITDPGTNFGWPIYEGPFEHEGYAELITSNSSAPNPLAGTEDCSNSFFSFQDLLLQENEQHDYFFSNPCNEFVSVPNDVETFAHQRPAIAYSNQWNGVKTYLPSFNDEGMATVISTDNPDSPVAGEPFFGSSGNGGVFLQGDQIPEEYVNQFLLSDFTGWIREFGFDENGVFNSMEHWKEEAGRVVHITQNPYDGCIYYSTVWPSYITRICFGGNLKPVVELTPDTTYGTSPHIVDFDASASYDPEGGPLTYQWEFGDGTTGTGPTPTHTYIAENGQVQSFEATLTVTDEEGAFTEKKALISLNNTPPQVDIISIEEGELYSHTFPTPFDLLAQTIDEEHNESQIQYEWNYLLRHNTHFHVLDKYEGNDLDLVVYPTACEEDAIYWYEINVTATDPGGLSSKSVRNIYCDCEGTLENPDGGGNDFILSPNPTTDFLELRSFVGMDNLMKFSVYAPTGKHVMSEEVAVYNGRQYCSIDVSNLSQGAYILEFSLQGKMYRERFVKLDF